MPSSLRSSGLDDAPPAAAAAGDLAKSLFAALRLVAGLTTAVMLTFLAVAGSILADDLTLDAEAVGSVDLSLLTLV